MAKTESDSDASAEDESLKNPENPNTSSSLREHTRNFFKNLDKKQKILAGLAGVLLLGGLLILTIKPLRLFALNLFSDANVVVLVLDSNTEQPVVGVDVMIDSIAGVTDENGKTKINGLDYGEHDVSLSKQAYEPMSGTIDVERNQQEFSFNLVPNGISVSVLGVNSITDEPLAGFEVKDADGKFTTSANEDGLATLNVPPGTPGLEITLTLDGFNQAKTIFFLNDEDGNPIPEEAIKTQTVKLVKSGRHHFLSNRDGPIGLWSSNYDGSDAKAVIKDLGRRSGSISMSLSPDGKFAIISAPIKGVRDKNGNLQNELYITNLETGENRLFDEGTNAQFNILEVENDRVVYSVRIIDKKVTFRGKIKSYTYSSENLQTHYKENEIHGANYIQNKVFFTREFTKHRNCSYCDEGFYNETTGQGFVGLDLANNAVKVVEKFQWIGSQFRNPHNKDEIFYEFWDDDNFWVKYNVNTEEHTKLDNSPQELEDPYPFDHPSPDGQKLVWIEIRDGIGTIISSTSGSLDESSAIDTGDLRVNYLIRWIDSDYLIVNGSESGGKTGNFIVHTDTGKYQLVTAIYENTYYYRYGYYGY